MIQRKRPLALIFSGIAIAAIVILAAGLSEVRLQPGRPFPFGEFARRPAQGSGFQFGGEVLLFVLRVFLFIVWLLMPFAIILLMH